ncbi:MAG: two-component regulator propeller domain-containing protein, partial [Arenimonas sp.]
MRLGLLFGLLCFCSAAFASLPETPQFRQLTVADGLPSSTLYAITQDKKGYLWIASKDGLARYDGVGYKMFRYAPGDDNALPGNVVQALHIDDRDQLWIAMEGQGISRLDAGRSDFTHYRKSTHPEMGSDDIWAITSSRDGNLWFGSYRGGLYRMDKGGHITRFMPIDGDAASLPSDTVLSLSVDIKNRLWVGTTKGLCYWDGKKFTRVSAGGMLDTYIMQLTSDADGSIWVGTQKGLLHISSTGSQLEPVLLPGKPITGLWQDRQRVIWFSDGPNVYQWRNRQLLAYTPDSQTPAKIYGVYEDHEGGFWFPTEDRGLLRLPAGWRNFSVFRHQPHDKKSLSGVVVHAAAQADADQAWLANDAGGLDKINLTTGRIDRVLDAAKTRVPMLWSVLQTRDGGVWAGHRNGMIRFDPDTGTMKHFPAGSGLQDTLPGAVRLMIQTNDGLLWSASYGGGIQARDESGKVVHRISEDLSLVDPDQFALSPDGQLWIATSKGLLRWNDDTEKFVAIDGSPHERIDAFCFLSADIVWLHRMGVLEAFQWNGKTLRSIRKVTGDDGLPPVEAGSLLPDRSGNLWLTTTRGLLRYTVLTNQLRIFGERDGLPSQEFDLQPALLTENGIALVSTSKGLVVFDAARVRNQTALSPLNLDGLSVRRGEDTINIVANPDVIRLEAQDHDLNISLRLLSFADSSAHRYRFLLKNFDSDWVDVGASGERVFSSLPAGKYQLLAKAVDAEGRWSEPLTMKLVVLAPWWRSKWALTMWGLLAAMVFLGMALLYQRRIQGIHAQRLRDQERELAQQNSTAKSHFLATLGHEIRTPMTGVLGMAELLQASELNAQQRHRVSAIQNAGQHLL